MSKTTLNKISEILGISKSTASKALNNYADVSPKTKAMVLNLAKELDYTPNSFAQNLRSQESKIIGLIVPEIVHYFFSNIILGVINAASKCGYAVVVVQSNDDYEYEVKQLDALLQKNVDGVLLSFADNTNNFKHVKSLLSNNVPLVLYDKISKLIDCNKVVIDDIKAAQMATQHLIDIGCKKIAIVRNKLKSQTTIDRYKGYKKALLLNDIEFDKLLDIETDDVSLASGKNAAFTIFENHKEVDAVFAVTDLLAIGVLETFKENNVQVPEQISIIGFSNWLLTQITTPHLSTIDQPGQQMGKVAFDLLYSEIINNKNNVKEPYKTVVIDTKVISRESTK